ncbi:MAG: YceI family protein [Myxococcota bacterium]
MNPAKLAAPAALGTIAAGIRWLVQGSGNLYTDLSHQAYVPDPVAGWRLLESGPLWLGLELICVLGGITIAVFVAARWLATRSPSRAVVAALWVVSAAALVPPLAAFATGGLPDDAVDTRPSEAVEAPTGGITASLTGLSEGRYTVQGDHPATSVIATVSAGGESFETRFGGVSGALTADPADLAQPFSTTVTLDATTVDTGVDLRSKSARDYLQVKAHPEIALRIDALSATERSAGGTVNFSADGSLAFAGDSVPVSVTGTLTALDAATRAERKVEAKEAVLVTASFELPIAKTVLNADASDFSSDVIPIAVSVLLTKS